MQGEFRIVARIAINFSHSIIVTVEKLKSADKVVCISFGIYNVVICRCRTADIPELKVQPRCFCSVTAWRVLLKQYRSPVVRAE